MHFSSHKKKTRERMAGNCFLGEKRGATLLCNVSSMATKLIPLVCLEVNFNTRHGALVSNKLIFSDMQGGLIWLIIPSSTGKGPAGKPFTGRGDSGMRPVWRSRGAQPCALTDLSQQSGLRALCPLVSVKPEALGQHLPAFRSRLDCSAASAWFPASASILL